MTDEDAAAATLAGILVNEVLDAATAKASSTGAAAATAATAGDKAEAVAQRSPTPEDDLTSEKSHPSAPKEEKEDAKEPTPASPSAPKDEDAEKQKEVSPSPSPLPPPPPPEPVDLTHLEKIGEEVFMLKRTSLLTDKTPEPEENDEQADSETFELKTTTLHGDDETPQNTPADGAGKSNEDALRELLESAGSKVLGALGGKSDDLQAAAAPYIQSAKDAVDDLLKKEETSPPPPATNDDVEETFSKQDAGATGAPSDLGDLLNQARTAAEPYIESVKTAAEPYIQSARDTAEPYIQSAKDAAEPYIETAKHTVEDILAKDDAPSGPFADVIASAKAAIDPYIESTKDKVDDLLHRSDDEKQTGNISHQIHNLLDDAAAAAEPYVESAKSTLDSVLHGGSSSSSAATQPVGPSVEAEIKKTEIRTAEPEPDLLATAASVAKEAVGAILGNQGSQEPEPPRKPAPLAKTETGESASVSQSAPAPPPPAAAPTAPTTNNNQQQRRKCVIT